MTSRQLSPKLYPQFKARLTEQQQEKWKELFPSTAHQKRLLNAIQEVEPMEEIQIDDVNEHEHVNNEWNPEEAGQYPFDGMYEDMSEEQRMEQSNRSRFLIGHNKTEFVLAKSMFPHGFSVADAIGREEYAKEQARYILRNKRVDDLTGSLVESSSLGYIANKFEWLLSDVFGVKVFRNFSDNRNYPEPHMKGRSLPKCKYEPGHEFSYYCERCFKEHKRTHLIVQHPPSYTHTQHHCHLHLYSLLSPSPPTPPLHRNTFYLRPNGLPHL